MKKKIATVVYLINEEKNEIYMARKTKKIGIGKYAGPGGKVEKGESVTECAIRETKEEIDISINPEDLDKVGILTFYEGNESSMEVHFFFIRKWQGTPRDSEEITDGKWFKIFDLRNNPQETAEMMTADYEFLPPLLSGKKLIGKWTYEAGTNQTKVLHTNFEEVEDFEN